MRINFEYIEYKNLMAVGNTPMKIDLNRHHSTLLAGGNGSGKSTILQAISYCLYGKFMYGIKLAGAINSINNKQLLTTCEFTRGEDRYKVVRGEKPKVFEIYKNGTILPQDAKSKDQQKKKLSQICLTRKYLMLFMEQ